MIACRICGNTSGNQSHQARELMFGTQEIFEYIECGYCGCLQIGCLPDDMSAYYPLDYYSFETPRQRTQPAWLAALRRIRNRHFLGNTSWLGRILAIGSEKPEYFGWLGMADRRSLDMRILDVGCGSGKLLLKLAREGFSNLLGVDLYIPADIEYSNGVKVLKQPLAQLNQRFDFVMLNHSFEHMPDPDRVLAELRLLLGESGVLMLRIPVANCYARRKYGIHWVGWDAPRHFYLHTTRSLSLVAERNGLEVFNVVYDSTVAQFIGSELYLLGTNRPSKSKLKLPPNQKAALEKFAGELNDRFDGDTACFYLRRA